MNDKECKKLQDQLWSQFEDMNLDDDLVSFRNSKDCEDMMEQYQRTLILALAGIEDVPEWYKLDEEE